MKGYKVRAGSRVLYSAHLVYCTVLTQHEDNAYYCG